MDLYTTLCISLFKPASKIHRTEPNSPDHGAEPNTSDHRAEFTSSLSEAHKVPDPNSTSSLAKLTNHRTDPSSAMSQSTGIRRHPGLPAPAVTGRAAEGALCRAPSLAQRRHNTAHAVRAAGHSPLTSAAVRPASTSGADSARCRPPLHGSLGMVHLPGTSVGQ